MSAKITNDWTDTRFVKAFQRQHELPPYQELLRDTSAHLERGVVYLPIEEMESAGYSEGELAQHTRNEAFRQLMRVQTARITEHFQRAEPGLALLDPRGRFAVRVAYDLYRRTLRQIESSGAVDLCR